MPNISQIPLETARHSMAHIMAAAVKKICPSAQLGIGPDIDEGFYYDFLLPEDFSFTTEALKQIGSTMKKLIKQNHSFEKSVVSVDEGRKICQDNPFKLELIDDLESRGETVVSFYKSGDFIDLCAGPHVESSRQLASYAWKLDRVAGAYWRGSEKNPMMQRIYALAFDSREELDQYIQLREEARRRDHRRIGAEMELFASSELVGKGLPMLLPKGATLRRILERFVVDEEIRRGYQHVNTPYLGRRHLYEVSGHWDHYQDGMYPPLKVSDDEMVLRPMTCPHHFMMYRHKPRSYRDLPLRLAEISPQFRKEQSGEVSGLIRIMMFHLADAHLFCTSEQLGEEFRRVVELVEFIMQQLGIDSAISYRASLRDENNEKYVDNPQMWEQGESTLLGILDQMGIEYKVGRGDAAFYGPKLDVQMRNVLGKEETVFTIQIDFFLPDKFDLTYTNPDGEKVRPVVIHRSSIGCLERTMAFLIEYYEGKFPLWLAPVQVMLITITDRQAEYCKELENQLIAVGIRTETDLRNESLGKKIREARLQRIPYLVILGDGELEKGEVTVRNRDTGNQQTLPLPEFVETLASDDKNRTLALRLAI